MALPTGLLRAVRNYLDITWDDPASDEKLAGIIYRGMKYIDGIAGSSMDYTVEGKPRELLLDYCRYARSNALNEFQTNYLHELLSLQINQEITEYKALVNLASLSVGSLEITPEFSPAVKLYTVTTSNAEEIITAIAASPIATVSIINDSTVLESGEAVELVDGKNIVTISVTNGTATTIYTVVITKE